MRGWGVACAVLLFGVALALAVLLVALAPAADAADCPNFDAVQVLG